MNFTSLEVILIEEGFNVEGKGHNWNFHEITGLGVVCIFVDEHFEVYDNGLGWGNPPNNGSWHINSHFENTCSCVGALGINHDVNNELNNNLTCLVQCKSNSTSIFNPYVVIEPFIVLKIYI